MNKRIRKTFIRQQGKSDCGIACLASVIKYHKGEQSLERLRELSGTSQQGTTLLGLYQAARQLGFEAEGLEAESVDNLKELSEPAILHVLIDNKLQHYFVFYGFDGNEKAIIGDPAEGIVHYSKNDLIKVWESKALLKLIPNADFQKTESTINRKKKWIVDLIEDDINVLLVALCLGIVVSVLGLTMIIFSQKLIDDILPSGNKQNLIFSIALVTLLLLCRNVFVYVRGIFLIRQASDFNNRIIQSFYSKLLGLPKLFFDTRRIGELITRMNDTRRIQSTISIIAGNTIIDLLFFFVSVTFIFLYSLTIGFLILGSIPLYLLLIILFTRKISDSQKSVMRSYADTESHYIDTIQGISAIKASGKEEFFQMLNKQKYGVFQLQIIKLGKLNIRFGILSECIGLLLLFTVLLCSSLMVLSKTLQLGEMVALLSLSGSIIPAINRLVNSNIQIQEAFVAFDRMFEFTSIKSEYELQKGEPIAAEASLNLKLANISFGFPGRKKLLKDVSLQVGKGELIVLCGESGGGKSTLMQLLQKFYAPESGTIFYNNISLNTISTEHWRNMLGIVPQDIKLFNGNLFYNITLSDNPGDYEAAIKLCQDYKFDFYFESFPQSYLTILGEEGVNISGGERQLVALARALFRGPRFLLLDEATSAMDHKTENFVIDLLLKLKSEIAIFMVTHRIKTAQRADRIYILEDGNITTSGNPNELIAGVNFFSELVRGPSTQNNL